MNTTPIFSGHVKDGKLSLERPKSFQTYLTVLEGKQIELVLRRFRAQRTGQQNRYYWLALNIWGESAGYRAEELHEALKLKFLPKDPDAPLVVARSTTELDTREFGEYMDRVVQLAAEMGVVIPAPGEME